MSDTPRPPEQPPQPGSPLPEQAASPNGQAPPPPAAAPARRRHRSYGCFWYFAILAVLTLAATATLIIFNLAQQLKPEELAKARKLWDEKGPKNYEFRYTKRAGAEDRPDHFAVVVRGGKVQSVTLNRMHKLDQDKLQYYSITALFNFIEDFMEMDRKPGAPKVYVVGRFSPVDGHLVRYVRRVMGTQQRVEILVEDYKRLDGE
jgi:hypothetical protein